MKPTAMYTNERLGVLAGAPRIALRASCALSISQACTSVSDGGDTRGVTSRANVDVWPELSSAPCNGYSGHH
eukprot:3337192-Amphidinium_carterae.1